MGTPDFSVPSLRKIFEYTDLKAVFTQPDRARNRGKKISFSPVKEETLKLSPDIPIYQPETLRKNPNCFDIIKEISPDIIIVAAYGQILPVEILNLPKISCVNVHASLLPRFRGASPINAAILHGDEFTGVSIMKMEKGLDTGAVYSSKLIPIEDMNYTLLSDKLSVIGAQLLIETLPHLEKTPPIPQDEKKATYAPLIQKSDLELFPDKEPALIIYRKIRAFSEKPAAFIMHKNIRIKVFKAKILENEKEEYSKLFYKKCADGKSIVFLEIMPEGKKKMSGEDYIRGLRSI